MKQLNVKQLKHIHYATANECILLHMNENKQTAFNNMCIMSCNATFGNRINFLKWIYECKKYLIVQLPVYCLWTGDWVVVSFIQPSPYGKKFDEVKSNFFIVGDNQRYYGTNILLHRTLVFKETGACLKIVIPNAINRNAKCQNSIQSSLHQNFFNVQG